MHVSCCTCLELLKRPNSWAGFVRPQLFICHTKPIHSAIYWVSRPGRFAAINQFHQPPLLTMNFCKTHLNVIHASSFRSRMWPLSERFPPQSPTCRSCLLYQNFIFISKSGLVFTGATRTKWYLPVLLFYYLAPSTQLFVQTYYTTCFGLSGIFRC
jgi:hypothetical protein